MLRFQVRRGFAQPPSLVQAVGAWMVGCPRLPQWLGMGQQGEGPEN